MTDLKSKRELNKGFANATSRGFEFVMTTAMLTGLGWVIDRWLETVPAFTIVFAVLAFAGNFARSWYAYDAEMTKLEAELPGRPSASDPS